MAQQNSTVGNERKEISDFEGGGSIESLNFFEDVGASGSPLALAEHKAAAVLISTGFSSHTSFNLRERYNWSLYTIWDIHLMVYSYKVLYLLIALLISPLSKLPIRLPNGTRVGHV